MTYRFAFVLQAMLATLFVPGTPVVVGTGPGEVVLADLNQDGHLDLVTRHLLQRRVSVLLGDGKGGFRPAAGSPITLTYQPGSIQIADVNGDGTPDLALSVSEREAVDVFLGDRKGGFTRAAGSPFAGSEPATFYTRAIHLADVNGDRRMDILIHNGAAHTIGVLFGDGRGSFAPGLATRLGFSGGRSACAFGDVDGDGRLDVVASHREDETQPGRVTILRGDGAGGFKEIGEAPIGAPGPFSIALADLNGDRSLDLAITHSHRHELSVLVNDGHGAFTRSAGSPFAIGTEAFGIVAADVDGDRRVDLVTATGTAAVVLLGDGTGRLSVGPSFRAGPGAYNLAAGDINEDGKVDLVMSSFEGDAVTVLLHR
jgi:hypothetical protein